MESWRLEPLGGGYARIVGACYTILIAFIDEVCEAERDDYLRLFSRHQQHSREAMRWLNKHFLRMTSMDNVHDLEGYDELVERLLRVLPPEDVLRHYRPEERLAGLRPEDYIHHFTTMTPEEQGEVVRAMSPEERAALRKQLDENS